jgi:hypothetical protein
MAKVLDAHAFHEAILNTKRNIAVQQKMVSQIGKSVDGIIALDSSLKGEGGEKIRQFYQECHKPFLMFYSLFLTKYMTTLTNINTAINEVDGNKDALIHESYLENDLTKGLSDAQQSTVNLTDETNKIIGQIQDLISVSSLDDSEVVSGFNDAKKQLSDLVQKINEFDATQSQSLESISKDIQTMEQHVELVQGMLSNGARTLDVYQNGFVKTTPQWQTMNKRNTDYVNFAREYPVVFQRITVESQYRNMYDLYYSGKYESTLAVFSTNSNITNRLSISKDNKDLYSKIVKKETKKTDGFEIKKDVSDSWDSDGVGNANLEFSTKEDTLGMKTKASIIDTEKMDDIPGFLSQQVLYGEAEVAMPYSYKSMIESIDYGQTIGLKGEVGVSKSSFHTKDSAVSADFTFGKAEAQANYENYQVNLGAEAAVGKAEFKVEPLEFPWVNKIQKAVGLDYDPYVGVDLSVGSIGISGSLGKETGIHAALGVGAGFSYGFQEDEDED